MKNETCVENHDGYRSTRTHWIVLYKNGSIVTYFNSFGVEHILEQIKRYID